MRLALLSLLLFSVLWGTKGLFGCPFQLSDSGLNSPLGDAEIDSPFRDSHRLSFECEKSKLSGVVPLLFWSSPSAVCGPSHCDTFFAMSTGVVSVVVDSVEGFSIWRVSHVFKEVLKNKPSRAHLDSSPSVVLVPNIICVIAPSPHPAPCPKGASIAFTVGKGGCSSGFDIKAPTRFCVSCSKFVSIDDCFLAAFAFAHPMPLSAYAFVWSKDRKARKNASRKVNKSPVFTYWRDGGITDQGIAHVIDGLMFSGRGLYQQICARAILC